MYEIAIYHFNAYSWSPSKFVCAMQHPDFKKLFYMARHEARHESASEDTLILMSCSKDDKQLHQFIIDKRLDIWGGEH